VWIGGCERFGTEAEALHDGGAEVFDDDIRASDQLMCGRPVRGRGEVQLQAVLAALQHGIRGVLPARSARRIDVDDFRAMIGEHARHQWARHVLAEVHHAQAVQDSAHVAASPFGAPMPLTGARPQVLSTGRISLAYNSSEARETSVDMPAMRCSSPKCVTRLDLS
jgi:hypothetical protein